MKPRKPPDPAVHGSHQPRRLKAMQREKPFRLVDQRGAVIKRFLDEAGATASFVSRTKAMGAENSRSLSLERLDQRGIVVERKAGRDLLILLADQIAAATVPPVSLRGPRGTLSKAGQSELEGALLSAAVESRSGPRNHYQRWDGAVDDQLVRLWRSGKTATELAGQFGRSVGAIKTRLRNALT